MLLGRRCGEKGERRRGYAALQNVLDPVRFQIPVIRETRVGHITSTTSRSTSLTLTSSVYRSTRPLPPLNTIHPKHYPPQTPSTLNTMGDVALFCLLQGDSIEQSFEVTISRKHNVSNLRKLIITECANRLQGVDANLLSLHRVSIAHSNEIQQLDLKDTPSLDPRTTIGELFPDIPRKSDFIFVVNGMMMLRRGLICVLLCSCR